MNASTTPSFSYRLFTTIFLLILLCTTVLAFEPRFDLNGDGTLNDHDIIVIKKAIAGETCSSSSSCDLTGDGTVDMEDYNSIHTHIYPGGFSQAPPPKGTIDLARPPALQPTPPGLQPPSVFIQLDQVFTIKQGSSAALTERDGFMISLTRVEDMTCLKAGSCPPSAAKVEFRPRDGIPRLWTLSLGHEEHFGNYKIHVKEIDVDGRTASFVVLRTGATSIGHELEPLVIRTGTPFKLTVGQIGYIEGQLKARLESITPGPCVQSPPAATTAAACSPTFGARFFVSIAGGGQFNYEIPLNGWAQISEKYTLYFKESSGDVGVFELKEGTANQQNTIPTRVQVSPVIPFKAGVGTTAFMLGTDGFEFTITGIEAPVCGKPYPMPPVRMMASAEAATAVSTDVAQARVTEQASVSIQPAVPIDAVSGSVVAQPTPSIADSTVAASSIATVSHDGMKRPIPPPCTPGAIGIRVGDRSERTRAGGVIILNDRYVLFVQGIFGTPHGETFAQLMIQDKTTEIPGIRMGIPFDLVVGQKAQSPDEPRFSVQLLEITKTACTPPPCPNQVTVRLETSDRGDFELIIGEGLKGFRGGIEIELQKVDPEHKRVQLTAIRQESTIQPCPQFSPLPPGWCKGKEEWTTDTRGCSLPPRCIPEGGPGQPAQPQSCNGCIMGDKCISVGVRLTDAKLNVPVYCEIDGTLSVQKKTDSGCQNNYECESNTCADSKCTSFGERLSGIEKEVKEQRGLLDTIAGWFKKLFGFGEE